jgi:hypothetical protein
VRLADPPSLLAGREDLLADLDTLLTGGDSSGPRTVALCGLGGVGKTSVAMEYARRHLAEVGVAWQFAADDPMVLAAGFGELAAQLGARDVVETRDPVASVHGVLAALPDGWLLVFDNVPDRASVEGFVPPAGHGRVLITSQDQNWPHGQALQVPPLDAAVAAEFLTTRTRDPDRQAARALAGQMDGLPLALEQAAAYILTTGETVAGYLDLFRERRADMLRRGEPTGYDKTVATTWTLAFERLQQTSPAAVGLLRLVAFCAPERIPLRLLLQPRPGLPRQLHYEVAPTLVPLAQDRLVARDAIAALRRYSLVTPTADGLVSVHQLVQAVTADQMTAELAMGWQQAATVLIEAAIPRDTRKPQDWHIFAALLPHAEAALTPGSDGMARMASYLGYSGSYVAARDLYKRVLNARMEALGAEHLDTLTARGNVAFWTGEAGDPAGARDQSAALLPVMERVLGAEHPDTLAARARRALWTGHAGDPAGARDQLAALLPVAERVLGAEHRETLAFRSSLAYMAEKAGDPAGARDQLAALLPVAERVLGAEHLDTLTNRANLADLTGQAGDPPGARDQFAALLPVMKRVLGAEHPDTLMVRNNLAAWTGSAGDPAGARDQFAALLPVRERVLGAEHPDTLVTRTNLACWTGEAGNLAAGCDQLAALLPVMERVLGAEHPITQTTRRNFAIFAGRRVSGRVTRNEN